MNQNIIQDHENLHLVVSSSIAYLELKYGSVLCEDDENELLEESKESKDIIKNGNFNEIVITTETITMNETIEIISSSNVLFENFKKNNSNISNSLLLDEDFLNFIHLCITAKNKNINVWIESLYKETDQLKINKIETLLWKIIEDVFQIIDKRIKVTYNLIKYQEKKLRLTLKEFYTIYNLNGYILEEISFHLINTSIYFFIKKIIHENLYLNIQSVPLLTLTK